jgi:soluble cytochrome b562
MAQRILRERQMSNQPQAAGAMGVQYQAPQSQMPAMRSGGIIAFKTGGGANEEGGEDEARIDMEKRLAMPPTTDGIMGAAPAAAPAPYVPQAGRAMQQAAGIPDFMKAQFADAEKRMGMPLSELMAEKKAAYAAEGVADMAEGQQQQRAGLMAEKANLTAENERTKNLRMAEFFARWGTTPGPVLVAGMNALKESVPGVISDEKEQKKARREIDKSIADLDNATRLEKRGEVDAAMALKMKAAEDMKALQAKFIDYQSRRESDISSAAASRYVADTNFRGEQLRSESARLTRIAQRETDDDNKRFNAYGAAAKNEQSVISKITDQAKLLEPAYETIKYAEMNQKQNDGVMSPAYVPAYEAAKKKIADQEKIWNAQKEQAARDTQLAYERVRINPAAAKDYARPAGSPAPAAAPAPSDGPISGDFKAPPAAAIDALRTNPNKMDLKTLKSDFDYHFGPGAADEYLRK